MNKKLIENLEFEMELLKKAVYKKEENKNNWTIWNCFDNLETAINEIKEEINS